ncbi:hypothetical protein PgNI_11292 [Pyricularia grisea]|uniref:Xylanolytic transcriptional activator regulatory domain-containing protein n=1 Tax=Pyricularia grisea TaxID=148305 RepID=A0A6P8APE0_PYRGI|nr:hypothetical protein PgNI_11292 [Pyricularia grisea]TLD03900.1 hypothetical protein PgNI_11292 [Pyricularia grisea]
MTPPIMNESNTPHSAPSESHWVDHGQDINANNNDEGRPAKRRKTRLASGAIPFAPYVCGACARRRLGPEQCVYIDPSSVHNDIDPQYVKSLEERIGELERARALSVSASTPATHHPAQQTSFNSTGSFGNNASTSGNGLPPVSPNERHLAASQLIHMQRLGRSDASDQSNQGSAGEGEPEENPAAGSAMGATETTPAESGRTVFLGRSSAAAFMREVQESTRRHRRLSGNGGDDGLSPLSDGGTTTSRRTAVRRRGKREREELAALWNDIILPPRRVADAHLSKYWESVHPLFPVLHKGSFVKWYESTWNHDPSEESKENETVHAVRAAHARLNIVLALGCSLASSEEPSNAAKKSANVFYERSRNLLRDADMDHGCSMKLVQAHILIAQYLQATDQVNSFWLAIGTAIRAAQGIGVNEDSPTDSQVEREERHRTWWGCILMDRVACMILGRPTMVSWRTVVPKPKPADDEALSFKPGSCLAEITADPRSQTYFFVETLNLADIMVTVLEHFYAPSPDSRNAGPEGVNISDLQKILEIDMRLARWRKQLPAHLQFPLPAKNSELCSTVFAKQAVVLHCRYLHLRILLFRPTTVELSNGQFFEAEAAGATTDFQRQILQACIRSSVAAARELIELIWNGMASDEGPPTPPWWYSVFYLYTAGTVILAILLTPSLRLAFYDCCRGNRNEEELLDVSWAQCVEALSISKRSGSVFAKRCLWILQAAYDQRATNDNMNAPEGAGPGRSEATGSQLVTVSRPHSQRQGAQTAITGREPEANLSAGTGLTNNAAFLTASQQYTDDLLLQLSWPSGNMDWLYNLSHGLDHNHMDPATGAYNDDMIQE